MNKMIHITKSFDMIDFTYQSVRIQNDINDYTYGIDEVQTLEFDTDLIHDKILRVIALDIEDYKRKLCETKTNVIAEFTEPSQYYTSCHKNFRGFALVIYNSDGIVHSIYEFRFKNLIRKINGIDFYRDDTSYECFMQNLIYGYDRIAKHFLSLYELVNDSKIMGIDQSGILDKFGISRDSSFINPNIKDNSFSCNQKTMQLALFHELMPYWSVLDPVVTSDSNDRLISKYIPIPNLFSSIKRNRYLCMDQGFITYVYNYYKKWLKTIAQIYNNYYECSRTVTVR